jgi:allantoinase
MQFDLIIRGGTVVTAAETYQADIGVKDGEILLIGDLKEAQGAHSYDASGKYVFPGFIDEHLHSRDPGLTHKEDFTHSTRSAAAGGITTVLEMPNTVPPVRDAATYHSRAEHLGKQAFVDFAQWAIVLGDLNRANFKELKEAGVVGYKLFWGYALHPKTFAVIYNFTKDDDVFFPPDEGEIYEAFREIAKTGLPVAIHAECSPVISRLATAEKKAGHSDYAAMLRSRPPFTEALTAYAGIQLAKASGVHLHILHIAAGEVVDLVAEARARGQAVTGETGPHYLALTDEDYPRAGLDLKIYPPIREKAHQDQLWKGIHSGALQTIGSDHAPHLESEKQGSIWEVPAGACGVQSMVPVMLDQVSKGRMTLNQIAALLSENPARVFGLYGMKGTIAPGADADFTIVDMGRQITIRKADMYSKNKITPFDGLTMQGAPVAAFLRGNQIMADGKPVGERTGRLIKPVAPPQAHW